MKTVVGIFNNLEDAENARGDFVRLGLSPHNVGMLSSVAPGFGAARPDMGLLDVPNVGRVAASGSMLSLLNQAAASKSPDGMMTALANMGITGRDAARYVDDVKRGAILETVSVEDEKEADALAIMRRRMVGAKARAAAKATEVVIPVVEEELRIGKRQIDAGGVRVTTRVRELPVEKTITVREEHVNVQRRPMDRPVEMNAELFADHVYELRATTEQPVVTKRARVVEEIRVHRESKERVQTIQDTLRRTNVQLAQIPAETEPRRARFLDHFTRTYGPGRYQFETLLPAYEFGDQLRDHYAGRDWKTIEGDVRTRWEQKNPGTWEQYSEAIRSSWERPAS